MTPVDVGTLAQLFDCTPRWIQKLAREGIIPRAERGKYDLVRCVNAYVKHLQDELKQKRASTVGANERLRGAKAEREELELRRRRGELLERSDLLALWTSVIGAFRARCLSIPSKAAPECHAAQSIAEIEALLREHQITALELLAELEPGSA